MSIHNFLKLIRVRQWVKNLFLVVPSFFAGSILELNHLKQLIPGVLSFCLVASGIYILNDIKDKSVDQLHPEKKFRPIAAGIFSIKTGILISVFLISSGLLLANILQVNFFLLVFVYLIVNISYSLGLKNISILDLLLVTIGFLIRIYAGGLLVDVAISNWLAIMVFLLALLLVVAKRKDDLLIQEATGETVRKSLKTYNADFINSCLTLLSAVIIVAYIMYTVSPEVTQRFGSEYLFMTTIFVIAGVMRYLQITFVEKKSGSPTEILLTDKFTVITLISWIVCFYILIYYK